MTTSENSRDTPSTTSTSNTSTPTLNSTSIPPANTNAASEAKPRGILRNRNEPTIVELGNSTRATETDAGTFDRKAVLENTKANAQLHAVGESIIKKNQTDLAQEVLHKSQKGGSEGGSKNGISSSSNGDQQKGVDNEHLKWDEANLYLTEQEKNATMKITEPKTPYQGSVGESEYYHDDECDDVPPLDDGPEGGLLLGEPEIPSSSTFDVSVENGRILKDEALLQKEAEEKAQQEQEETPEERHKRFEEMRKKHYHMKGSALHHLSATAAEDEDEEEDDDEDDEAMRQAKANALANLQK